MHSGYREYPPPVGLEDLVACVWQQEPVADHHQRVLPDACVDLIWLAGRDLVFFGADTGPRVVRLHAGTLTTGIRLRPGAAGAVLGLPASEIRDHQIRADHIWGLSATRLADALAVAGPSDRLDLLAGGVRQRGAEPEGLVIDAAHRLAVPAARVSTVAGELGVSERHLHRRIRAAVGYGPKMLARVARLRRLISLEDPSLASRALRAGYASQSHMSDEVRRMTGLTPVRFLEDAVLTAV